MHKKSVKSDYLVTTYLQSFIDPIESHLNPELTEEVSAFISYRNYLSLDLDALNLKIRSGVD